MDAGSCGEVRMGHIQHSGGLTSPDCVAGWLAEPALELRTEQRHGRQTGRVRTNTFIHMWIIRRCLSISEEEERMRGGEEERERTRKR